MELDRGCPKKTWGIVLSKILRILVCPKGMFRIWTSGEFEIRRKLLIIPAK